eukprot:2930859-Rhodomonas_salina.3
MQAEELAKRELYGALDRLSDVAWTSMLEVKDTLVRSVLGIKDRVPARAPRAVVALVGGRMLSALAFAVLTCAALSAECCVLRRPTSARCTRSQCARRCSCTARSHPPKCLGVSAKPFARLCWVMASARVFNDGQHWHGVRECSALVGTDTVSVCVCLCLSVRVPGCQGRDRPAVRQRPGNAPRESPVLDTHAHTVLCRVGTCRWGRELVEVPSALR